MNKIIHSTQLKTQSFHMRPTFIGIFKDIIIRYLLCFETNQHIT